MVEARPDTQGLTEPMAAGDGPQLFEGEPQRVGRRPPRSGFRLIASAMLLAAGVVAIYFGWRDSSPPSAPLAPPLASAPAPAAEPPPAVKFPVEGLAPSAEKIPLPPLAESDTFVLDGLAGVIGSGLFDRVVRKDIVRRIVATVDNLPRKSVAPRVWPIEPTPGRFATAGSDENLVIASDNAKRYAPYVRMAEAVDMKTLAALYLRFYPLFQDAYRELGFPDAYFNDRLVAAIDDLLAAPLLAGPVRLTQPKVFYAYADPHLEDRSAGQKIMMRIGAENAARVKAVLTSFRREIAGPVPKQ
jgi:hypothetical protein